MPSQTAFPPELLHQGLGSRTLGKIWTLTKQEYFGQSYELLMEESMAQTFSKSVNLPPEAHTWLSWLPGAEPRADVWKQAPAVSRHTGKVGTDDGYQYVKEMLVKTCQIRKTDITQDWSKHVLRLYLGVVLWAQAPSKTVLGALGLHHILVGYIAPIISNNYIPLLSTWYPN